MGRIRRVGLMLVAASIPMSAQEVELIDLVSTPQRVELRYPPAPEATGGTIGGYGGVGIGCGGSDDRDPHSLGVYLEAVNPECRR
jgi:hypothetical protein